MRGNLLFHGLVDKGLGVVDLVGVLACRVEVGDGGLHGEDVVHQRRVEWQVGDRIDLRLRRCCSFLVRWWLWVWAVGSPSNMRLTSWCSGASWWRASRISASVALLATGVEN